MFHLPSLLSHGQKPAQSVVCVSVRFKKFGRAVIPHRKPRWMPMARSKMFVDPPTCTISQAELEHEKSLFVEYNRRMKALVQYLHEDEAKFSDTGEAGKLEAEQEERDHIRLLKENEEENLRIAEQRKLRLKQEMKEVKLIVDQNILYHQQKEEQRLKEADSYVKKEIKSFANRIQPQDLEAAILDALDNPIDPEFALDREGHIYRGRQTKSLKVPRDKREKLTKTSQFQRQTEVEEIDLVPAQSVI